MKKLNFLLSTIALGAVLTSCQSDLSDVVSPSDEANNATIIAYEAATSRTSVDGATGVVKWVGTDELGVYSSTDNNSKFSGTSGDGAFTGTLTNPTAEVLSAVYPYEMGARYTPGVDVVNYTFDLPDNQNQKYSDGVAEATSLGAYTYMYGRTAVAVANNAKIEMNMNHLMTFFDLNLSNIPANTKILSVELKGAFAKTANVTLPLDATTPASVALSTETFSSITVDLFDGANSGVVVSASGELKVRLAMFPQDIPAGEEWNIEVISEIVHPSRFGDISAKTRVGNQFNKAFAVAKSYAPCKVYAADIALTFGKTLTYDLTGTTLKAKLATAGIEDLATIDKLTLTGAITNADLNLTRDLSLRELNLRGVTSVNLGVTGKEGLFPEYLYCCHQNDDLTAVYPAGVAKIGSTLERVYLPANMTDLSRFVFEACNKLQYVKLPDNLKVMGASAFERCNRLVVADLPEGLTTLNAWCFEAVAIKEIVMPLTLEYIGNGVINGSEYGERTKSVKFMSQVPPEFDRSNNTFKSCKGLVLKVPTGSKAAYTTAISVVTHRANVTIVEY